MKKDILKDKTLKSAVLYTRVSMVNQKNNLKLQDEICREYCINNSIEIVKVFSDVASGADRDRPGIADVINYCRENKIDLLTSTGHTVISRISDDYNYFYDQLNKSNTKILLIENTRNDKDH